MVCGSKAVLKDAWILIPGTYKEVTLPEKGDLAYVIKVKDLEMSGLFWSSSNCMSPSEHRIFLSQGQSQSEIWQRQKDQRHITLLALKLEEGYEPKYAGIFRSWRKQGNRFSSRRKGNPPNTLIFTQWHLCLISGLQNCKCCLSLWLYGMIICYGSNWKQIQSYPGLAVWLFSSVIITDFHFHFSLSCIREGNGNPLQCSCLENPRDSGAWWAAVSGVVQSRTWPKRLSSSSAFSQATAFCWQWAHSSEVRPKPDGEGHWLPSHKLRQRWQLFLVTHPEAQTHQQVPDSEVANSWFQNQHCFLTFTFNPEINLQVRFCMLSFFTASVTWTSVIPLPLEYCGDYIVPLPAITL